MKPKSRSLSGATLMLIIIPVIVGLLACMPVPIGNPERSKLDPNLTGVWVTLSNEELADEVVFYIFEPYDKRTWLITGLHIAEGEDADLSQYDLSTYKGIAKMAATEPVRDENVYADGIVVYKAWLTRLGGERFMTWEPKILLDDGISEPEIWFVYRIIQDDADTIRMNFISGENSLFKGVKETRRAYEKVIRKNADNPELYDDDDFVIRLARVQGKEMGFFEKLLSQVVAFD
jgi:hypothetical protein